MVVTLTEDRFIRKGPGRPVFNEGLRAETVGALSVVDYVATSPWPTAVETLEHIQPDLYVKGQDYKDHAKDVTGAIAQEARTVERFGGRMVCTEEIEFSSTRLLNEHFSVFSDEQRTYLTSLRERFSCDDVLARLDALRSTSALVVGEAIIDEYHYCTPDAMSNKSPTLSARFEAAEVFAGGVVPVGNHVAGLCQEVHVLAGVGADGRDDVVTSHLADGVTATMVRRADAPTVCKRRFVHRFLNQKLFEITFLDDRPIPKETQRELISRIEELAPEVDLVIALDFGHGFFTPEVVESLRERSRFLAVNAQINSSNKGFNNIRKYVGADYISVDEHELRLPFGDRYGPLEDLVAKLREESGCQRINVTLGDKGTLYFEGPRSYGAPVLTNGVVDTMGAGDALLAATALMVQSGAEPELVPFVGNCMGGMMTQIVGHRRPVDGVDLYKFVATLMK